MEYIDWIELYTYLSMAKAEFERRYILDEDRLCKREIEKIENLQKKILDKIGEVFNEKRRKENI